MLIFRIRLVAYRMSIEDYSIELDSWRNKLRRIKIRFIG
jgi:hypothetical protein